MLPRTAALSTLVALALVAPNSAQGVGPIDQAAVEFLREQGLEHSMVMDHLSWICDVYGPRLTGSPNLRHAQDWAVKTFKTWGLSNAHLEEWGPFGRGWNIEHFDMEVIGANPWPVHAWPKAWSPSIDGRIEAEVVLVDGLDPEALAKLDLNGKIVFLQGPRDVSEPFEATANRRDAENLLALADSTSRPRQGRRRGGRREARNADFRQRFARIAATMNIVYASNPLALVDRGRKGDYGTIFVSAASMASSPDVPRAERPRPWSPKGNKVIPQFTMAVEHYNRICRILEKGQPVRIALELKTRFHDDDPMQRNVVAEIPGTDPEIGDQVVMLGGHYDSWHSGTGATDNGAGSATMMEAIRLIHEMVQKTGKGPRRTIRIALWSGEEQGLLGSRAYVAQHFGARGEPTAEHAKLSGYFNLDNGTGKIRGVYLQGNAAEEPIFRAWLQPFHDLGAATVTIDNTGGTDHQSFDGVGLPGFQFIQDEISYSPRTHHSNMDSWDHAIGEDLEQAATIVASFVWHAAQRDEMLPRKPLPEPGSGGRRR